jgi:hypothetical protein
MKEKLKEKIAVDFRNYVILGASSNLCFRATPSGA